MQSMLDEPTGLSPDLEWMLQSPQVSRADLVEALVEAFYFPLYQLAFAFLDDEGAATEAVRNTFRAALDRRGSFRGEAKLWIHRLALEACKAASRRLRLKRGWRRLTLQLEKPYRYNSSIPANDLDVHLWEAFDGLDPSMRLLSLLHSLLEWPVQEIARLLGKSAGEVQRDLSRTNDQLAAAVKDAPADPSAGEFTFDVDVHESLHRRWPANVTFVKEQLMASALVAEERTSKRPRGLGQVTDSLRETVWVWAIILLALGLVWGSNRMLSEPTSSPLSAATPARTLNTPAQTRIAGAQTMEVRQPAAQAKPTVTPTPPVLVDYYTRPGDTLRSIAARLGVSQEEMREINHFSLDDELQEGRRLQVPLPPGPDATPTPVITESYHLPALDLNASSDEIYTYLLLSEHLWQTLWGDVRLIDYGPPGYVGPPVAARIQAWIAQPGQGRELIGTAEGEPIFDILIVGERIYYQMTQNSPGESSWDLQEVSNPTRLYQTRDLVFPGQSPLLRREGKFRPAGIENILEREVLVADWFDGQGVRRSRLWIDTLTGIILRFQRFAESDGKTLQSEILFTSIQLDENFPEAFFDPSQGWLSEFAQDSSGQPGQSPNLTPAPTPAWTPAPGHEPLYYTPAPTWFNPSHSQLTFQYLPDLTGTSQSNGSGRGVDLFAGRYYLGSLDLADPHSFQCDRSMDGQWVALYTQVNGLEFKESMDEAKLVLFNLHHLAGLHRIAADLDPTDFAFAPDSLRLAISGFNRFSQKAELVVFEIETNTINQLLTVNGYTQSLTWSPDGQYLALIGEVEDARKPEALIVRVRDGQIIYRTPVEEDHYLYDPNELQEDPDWPAPDWPAREWGVKFPVFGRDLGDCSQAPE